MRNRILIFSMLATSGFANNLSFNPLVTAEKFKVPLKYESLEHKFIGSNVKLMYLDEKGCTFNISGDKAVLLRYGKNAFPNHLNNLVVKQNFSVTFAEMIYLSGDYMADPEHQIAAKSSETAKANFILNFSTFMSNPTVEYIYPIMQIVDQDMQRNIDNISNGKVIDIPDDDNLKLNCATGGGCHWKGDLLINPGYYMKVATKMFDHFGNDAIASYQTGHRLAMDTAINASTNDELTQAYAYEAYADHFLTDLFAGGHIRTQIKQLSKICNTDNNFIDKSISEKIGMSFAHIMHNKDNADGVVAIAKDGSKWKSYGDAHLFIPENAENLSRVVDTVQLGINQIFLAYTKGKTQQDKEAYINNSINQITSRLPDVYATSNYSGSDGTPMLFMVDKNNNLYEAGVGKTTCLGALGRHWREILAQ